MMDKIKLTQEQAKAIKAWLLERHGNKAELLNVHAMVVERQGGWSESNPYRHLNGLDQSDMARALLIGYEVEPEYKVGDWVAFIKLLGNHIISKVESVTPEKVMTDCVSSNGYKQQFDKETIRHATSEEIKAEQERRAWESIGRDIRAFKIGDIYVDINNNCREIYNGKSVSEARRKYDGERIKGFYPAESFISFGDSNETE